MSAHETYRTFTNAIKLWQNSPWIIAYNVTKLQDQLGIYIQNADRTLKPGLGLLANEQ